MFIVIKQITVIAVTIIVTLILYQILHFTNINGCHQQTLSLRFNKSRFYRAYYLFFKITSEIPQYKRDIWKNIYYAINYM